jgi:hypothetical protein
MTVPARSNAPKPQSGARRPARRKPTTTPRAVPRAFTVPAFRLPRKPERASAAFDPAFLLAARALPPRDAERFAAGVLAEAARAGAAFYYPWAATEKDRARRVDGGSVGLAACLLRHYGNATVIPEIDGEDSREWRFRATFADLETGVATTRLSIQRKPRPAGDPVEASRAREIAFQAGQGKALRTVILAAMPGWVVAEAIAAAKTAEAARALRVGVVAARDEALADLALRGVDAPRIARAFGKDVAAMDEADVAALRGMVQAIADGHADAESLLADAGEDDPPPDASTVADGLFDDAGGDGR